MSPHRARIEAARRRMPAEDLAALLKVSGALTSSLDVEAVLQRAIESAVEVLRLETGAIYLLEDDWLVLGATTPPLPPDFPEEYRRAPLRDHPHVGSALRECCPVIIADVEDSALTGPEREVCEMRGLRSILYVPLTRERGSVGVLIVGSTHVRRDWDDRDLDLCQTLAHQISLAVVNAKLYETVTRATESLVCAYDDTLRGWSMALEMRDEETRGHTERAADLTVELARDIGVSGEELPHVRRGVLLHDIGKMAVPDAILLKPGPLTEAEWEVMRRHPVHARDFLARIDYLAPALDIPYCHHERWDGSGYPQGLVGEGIPLAARIFAVVDVYDALTSDRPYRPAWRRDDAIAHIRDESGRHFDPQAVDSFLGFAWKLTD